MPQPHPAAAVDDDLAQHAVAQVRRQHLAVRMVGRQAGEGQPAAAQPEQVAALAQPDHGVDQQPRRQPNTEECQCLSRGRQHAPAPVCDATSGG